MCWRQFRVFSLILCVLVFQGCSDDASDKVADTVEPSVDDAANADAPDDSSLPLAPGFTLLNTELEEVRLSDAQGKVVLVDFWATWCKPCKEEIPLFIELYDEYREQGFEMLGISTDDVEGRLENIELFFQELSSEGFDINYAILLADPEIIQRYGVLGIPSAFLINRNGRIVKVFNGAQDDKTIYESELKKWL